MITHGDSFRSTTTLDKPRFPRHIWRVAVMIVLALFALAGPLQAQSPDDQYVAVMSAIEQADSLREASQTDSARAKYQEAQTALLNLKKNNPTWNVKVVSYRLNYVTEKIAALTPKSKPVAATNNVPATATNDAPTVEQEGKPAAKTPT